MARIAYAAQIDLRFRDSARQDLDASIGIRPCDLMCESLHLFTQRLVKLDR